MRYRSFGSTGWQVSAIGFGGVPLSFGERPSEERAIEVIQHAVACGIDVFDTADSYCRDETDFGHNERLIGRGLALLGSGERDRIKVFTKGGYLRPGGAKVPNGRPEYLRAACDGSLAALGVDRIDLYQHHVPDPEVPVGESVGGLAQLQQEGKIEHIGVSNYSVAQIEEARSVAPIQSVQNQYSVLKRNPESDGTLEAAARCSIAFIPWAPLGGLGVAGTLGTAAEGCDEVARRHGVSAQRVALAWLLSRGEHVFPIPGSSRKETVEDSAAAADLELSSEDLVLLG